MTARHTLDRPALAPLWRAVHDRLSSGRPVATITLDGLGEDTREALADLLGLDRLPGTRTTLNLDRLDRALRESLDTDVRTVVQTIRGPLGNRTATREQANADRSALWQWLMTHPMVTAQPALADWTATVKANGLIGGSAATTRTVLTQALTVLAALPADGQPLPDFAANILGSAHALDDNTRLSGLVLRALAALHDTTPPASAAQRRALWAQAGIADDALSSTVLTAGLRPGGDGPVAACLRAYSTAGHATHLTLAQLRNPGELGWRNRTVHVFENPSIIALALRRFGAQCPPLVCTSGWPNSAVTLLLRQLAAAGAPLRYHGDFDGEGIRIAAHVIAATGAEPWRMSTTDYQGALPSHGDNPPVGRVTEAPWDPDLATALHQHEAAVHEEHTAATLMNALAHHVHTVAGQGSNDA
ncbi:TIGR02679 family protein [Peterkaempfera sp. SMS 1(5)a]|uniref:TIGR02679 family protein n=1 Tax=Peterkaempfera podocarpi TaxID=3232308 RepID=UPI00366BCC85